MGFNNFRCFKSLENKFIESLLDKLGYKIFGKVKILGGKINYYIETYYKFRKSNIRYFFNKMLQMGSQNSNTIEKFLVTLKLKGQISLYRILKSLFPGESIIINYRHPDLLHRSNHHKAELDIS